uniref:hypothetical protein n=1 Tax=Altererythrobacter segetis TaxID=1104773 RepID=UPI00140CBCD7|nr:hypothetical protein [Altererythrobacter segetis]
MPMAAVACASAPISQGFAEEPPQARTPQAWVRCGSAAEAMLQSRQKTRDSLANDAQAARTVTALDADMDRLRSLENRFFGFVLEAKVSDAQLKKMQAKSDAEFATPEGAQTARLVMKDCVAELRSIDAG